MHKRATRRACAPVREKLRIASRLWATRGDSPPAYRIDSDIDIDIDIVIRYR